MIIAQLNIVVLHMGKAYDEIGSVTHMKQLYSVLRMSKEYV